MNYTSTTILKTSLEKIKKNWYYWLKKDHWEWHQNEMEAFWTWQLSPESQDSMASKYQLIWQNFNSNKNATCKWKLMYNNLSRISLSKSDIPDIQSHDPWLMFLISCSIDQHRLKIQRNNIIPVADLLPWLCLGYHFNFNMKIDSDNGHQKDLFHTEKIISKTLYQTNKTWCEQKTNYFIIFERTAMVLVETKKKIKNASLGKWKILK